MADTMSRRTFVGSGAGAAIAIATGTPAYAAKRRRGPRTSEERHDVVIVGSGFGGGITARRLAGQGIDSLVLERGRRWITGPNANCFPHGFTPDRRAAWFRPTSALTVAEPGLWKPWAGILERVEGQNMNVVCGAAVGGSSVPYHGMTLQPPPELFGRVLPSIDYEPMRDRFYPLVERELGIAPIPEDLLATDAYKTSRLFIEDADKAGFHGERIPMVIDWEFARRELRGEMKPSLTTGDVLYGVNNGGKHSVDATYLRRAEASGRVEVRPLHWVRSIAHGATGGYVLVVDRIDEEGKVLERKRIRTRALFLGAGSAGTTRLLVRAKGSGAMPDLPDDVGGYWGNNGDRIFFRLTLPGTRTSSYQGGPACVGFRDLDNPAGPVTVVHGSIPLPDIGLTSVIAFTIPDGHGSWSYDRRSDDAKLVWPRDAEVDSTKLAYDRVARHMQAAGGIPVDENLLDPVTYHPLGGAVLGKVTDNHGRVHGHPGLYVTDGALIPGSTGCVNPSKTIAALAERNVARWLARDAGRVFAR